MDMDVQGSHELVCGVNMWFPWMMYERPMDDMLIKEWKKLIR